MPEILQTFLVSVGIIEGRHYVWLNTNSAVLVQIDNMKKYSSVRYRTDCPYHNEYFVFEFFTTFEKIIDKNVTITVFRPGSILRKRKILGYLSFDVGTIWYQKDHLLYHKWAILTAPNVDYVSGTQGYLKIDVSVLSRGETSKIPAFIDTNEIEGNLFLPGGTTTDRQKVNFIFDIYRGMDLVKKNPSQEGYKKFDNLPTTNIGVTFSGTSVKTTTKKNISAPVWNERLLLSEVFPPLCQRFKIDLYHEGAKRATRQLNLRSISNDNEEGFLPMFGPSFIHFYSPNNLEGYLGKVLLSLQTIFAGDLADFETNNTIGQAAAPPLREEYFLKFESVVLFATVFDVTSIKKKFCDKQIYFRLSCGAIHTDESGDKDSSSVSLPMKPKVTNKNYGYLPIDHKKPCLHLTLTLPDIRKRMFNYNLLTKMIKELKQRLDKIEDIFLNKDYKVASVETETLLLETLDFITSAAQKYIDIASNYNLETDPPLDQQRLKMCLKEMEFVVFVSQNIVRNQSKRKIFQKLEKLYTRIDAIIDIIEDWPRIYLWMIHGNKRVAYYIIHPRDIIHSPVEEEKGMYCGVLRSIYFQTESNQHAEDFVFSACKMNIMLWMGFARHLHNVPPSGFVFSKETIPKYLIAEESYYFQTKAYIYQGKFTPGADKSGLCDPFVDVIMGPHFRQTQILKKSLTPVWDQTLSFPNMLLYGSLNFIIANPPTISFEVYDKDEFWKFEPVGKCVTKPVVRTKEGLYSSKLPVKLTWQKVYNEYNVSGELLAGVELVEVSEDQTDRKDDGVILKIPQHIKPNVINHRIEVVFWGVRNLKKVQMGQITKPKIVVECGNLNVSSDTLPNAKKNLNFTNPLKMFQVSIPGEEYAPPLSLKMFDCRNFGINVFAGTHVTALWPFFYKPITGAQREARIMQFQQSSLNFAPSLGSIIHQIEQTKQVDNLPELKDNSPKINKWLKFFIKLCGRRPHEPLALPLPLPPVTEVEELEDSSDFDWWTKFYASQEETPTSGKIPLSHKYKLKVYQNELEKQPEFGGFTDTLLSFPMYKGKKTGDETIDEENTTGILKGAFKIYEWPLNNDYVTFRGLPLEQGMFQDFPSNAPVRFVVRIYCVKGLNLRPKDVGGKSDPYIRLTLNQQAINDKDHRIMQQLNPVFGRCFEMKGVFPEDHTLVITVMDYDVATADDLIGETKIDLENRFYTKHRANCGIAQNYLTAGYCQWRGQQKPTTILEILCHRFNISNLLYERNFVRVASKVFSPENFIPSDNEDLDRQILALEALKHWSEIPLVGYAIVPEHVETRSLYNPQIPGIEQLWIDIFPCIDQPSPKQVNIAPRKPLPYELRVIIWNAHGIRMLEKDILTGGKKADIFVKGWVAYPSRPQFTDVHYRSLNGEAKFNWRFIFSFYYLSSENKIIVKKKSLFGGDEYDVKKPCRLTLQSWDNDTFTFNDFLGSTIFELSNFQRGAPTAQASELAHKRSSGFINLFKVRRTKGWWSLKSFDPQIQKEVYGGSLELEFELVTGEEAEKSPVGLGREDPQGLSKPDRPESSFSWFKNPFRAIKFTMKLYKKKCLKIVILAVLIFVIVIVCFSLPWRGLTKMLGI